MGEKDANNQENGAKERTVLPMCVFRKPKSNREPDWFVAGLDGSPIDSSVSAVFYEDRFLDHHLNYADIEMKVDRAIDEALDERSHDLKSLSKIRELIKSYKENSPHPIPKGFAVLEADFYKDPVMAVMLEFHSDVVDAEGSWAFRKKVIKNWKYYLKPQENFKFWQDYAKFILRNFTEYLGYFATYRNHLDVIAEQLEKAFQPYLKSGSEEFWHNINMLELRAKHKMMRYTYMDKMSAEHLIFSYECMNFVLECLDNVVAKYRKSIDMIHFQKLSYEDAEKKSGRSRGSIERDIKNAIDLMAERLIMLHFYKTNGATVVPKVMKEFDIEGSLKASDMIQSAGMLIARLLEKNKKADAIIEKNKRKPRTRK